MGLHFSCASAALVRELGLLAGAVERRTTIPILSNVKFAANGSGKLHLTATDLDLAITTAIDADIHAPGATTLPAKRILDYLRLLPTLVAVKVGENEFSTITAGKSRSRMPGLAVESFPELPPSPGVSARIKALDLAGLIKRTQHAISTEETRFTLVGALLVFGETTSMVATDGHRLALAEIPVDAEGRGRFLVPRKALNQIIKLAESAEAGTECRFGHDENYLFFTIGTRQICARKMTGNFPDFERVLPKALKGKATFDVNAAVEALKRVRLTADERSHAIRLKLSDGEMRVFSSVAESGESEETVTATIDGPDLEAGFNADYLVDALTSCDGTSAAIHYIEAKSAIVITAADSDGLSGSRNVVMPMRL